jgi:glycine oxidase
MSRLTVVGGGVIGLSCAWRLARAGHTVTVCDAAPEAREASWAAAGMLAPHLEAHAPDDLWRFGVESLALWPEFAAALGGAPAIDYGARGGLLPVQDDEDERDARARLAFLAAAGVDARWLGPAELLSIEPNLSLSLRGALLVPGGQVDTRRLLAALQSASSAAGVRLRYGTAVRRIAAGEVELADGASERADQVVIASGAWTPALAAASGLALQGEPVKGQLVRLRAPDGLLARFVFAHQRAYLVPRAGSGIVIGATMVESGFDKAEDAGAIARLAENARVVMPALREAAIAETWTGLRPRLQGGHPLVARAAPGLIVATGHFRNGILLSPATAEAVLALAEGRAPSAAAAPFACLPARGATR